MYKITVAGDPGLVVSYISKFNFSISSQVNDAIPFLTEDQVDMAMMDIQAVCKAKGISLKFKIVEG